MEFDKRSRCARWQHWMVTAALLLSWPLPMRAQKVSDQEVKAAYLYNFAKFVEWPAGAFASSDAPIRLCLFAGDALEPDLKEIVQGKFITAHPVMVVSVRSQEEYHSCHVLFLGPDQEAQSKRILEALRGASVLTVSDVKEFAQGGGMIQFVLNQGRVQFQVNHRAALQAQLTVSSRLLHVATAVIE